MTAAKYEIIAFPHNADLDLVAAARCLILLNSSLTILHPVRLNQNAWEAVRKQGWFKSIKFKDLDFSKVAAVHLLGITLPKHNPELVDQLVRHNIRTVSYANRESRLPISTEAITIKTISFTAHFLQHCLENNYKMSKDDLFLFSAAVTEKTWAGLAGRVTNQDLEMLARLRKTKVSTRRIANSIVLGLREGQIGLYHKMLKNIEDIHPGNWPISLICINSSGQVQDLEPVVDAVWSDISPPIMVICISSGNFTRVWARSSVPGVDFAEVFKDFRPRINRNWVCFSFSGNSHQMNTLSIKDYLARSIPADLTAEQIMSASPQCIDWGATVKDAMDAMLRFNIMSLVVLKEKVFAGLITRRDLDRAVQMELLDSPIGPYVPTSIPTVGPATPVRVLKNIMVRFNLTRIPVVDSGNVVGIITSRELLRSLPDYLPLPPDYLPLAEQTVLPSPTEMADALKRVFSVKALHILAKIGKTAEEKGIQAFAVGGFVRDLLLEKSNLDIDIVVIGDAIPFAKSLSKDFSCDYKVFDRFHTARIYLEDMKIDFSSARIEHYPDPGALPQIEFSGLSNDLFRRDFTINTLALALNPQVFLQLKDFFGGYSDLTQKKIKILHSFSFLEDPTRLFRALRFARRFNFSLEKDTRRAFDLAIHRGCLHKLSKKRIGSEISRCLKEERPHKIVEDLFNAGLMEALSPELTDISLIPGKFRLVKSLVRKFKNIEQNIDEEAILWTGLLSAISRKEAASVLDSIGAHHSRRIITINCLKALEEVPRKISSIPVEDSVSLFYLLEEFTLEALIALMAFSLEKHNSRKVLRFILELRGIRPEITGKDLINAGIPPGAHMRTIFRRILNLKLEGSKLDKQKEIEIAKQSYKDLSI
ncbi:MAG: CBS domain-containing protein [Candidatus Rifleibacteriota bacterium]